MNLVPRMRELEQEYEKTNPRPVLCLRCKNTVWSFKLWEKELIRNFCNKDAATIAIYLNNQSTWIHALLKKEYAEAIK